MLVFKIEWLRKRDSSKGFVERHEFSTQFILFVPVAPSFTPRTNFTSQRNKMDIEDDNVLYLHSQLKLTFSVSYPTATQGDLIKPTKDINWMTFLSFNCTESNNVYLLSSYFLECGYGSKRWPREGISLNVRSRLNGFKLI